MKRSLLLFAATATLLAACADRPRNNPMDPKNPDSEGTRAVLVELFTTDSMEYTVQNILVADSAWTVTESLGVAAILDSSTPGTTLVISDSVTNDSLISTSDSIRINAVGTVNVNDSIRITYYHNTQVAAWDTLQYHEPFELAVNGRYDADNVIVAEYHLQDVYACAAAAERFKMYQDSAKAAAADTVAAVYFNGTGAPVDASDTTVDIASHEAALDAALDTLTAQTSYYTVEGDLSVSTGDSTTTLTGSGRLARLGADDGSAVTIRYIFTWNLSSNHPFVVVGTYDNACQFSAPEAGTTYELSERSITVPFSIDNDEAYIIVVVQDAATGEVLQTVLDR